MFKFVLLCLASACAVISIHGEEVNGNTAENEATLAALAKAISQMTNTFKEAGQKQVAESVAAAVEAAAAVAALEEMHADPSEVKTISKRDLDYQYLSRNEQQAMKNLAKTVKHMAATLVDKEVAEKLNIQVDDY